MIKKKVLLLLCAFMVAFPAFASSDPVELTAPKTNTVKTVSDGDLQSGPQNVTQAEAAASAVKNDKTKVQHKIHFHHHKKIVVDYNRVSKLIEYNYFDEADNILNGAIDRNSKDINALSLRVVSLAKQTKLEPAQNELNILLKKYPDNSNLHYAQGIIYYQRTTSSNMFYRNNSKKLFADALSEFKKAIELNKNNAPAYNAAGVISVKLGKRNDAKEYFNRALDIDKTYSIAIDNLGTLDFIDGRFYDAEKKFKQALSFNTQNTTAMYHLAQIAMQRQDYITALNYLNDALAINSNSPAIYNLMGKLYNIQGNEVAAINMFKKSVAVKPEFTLSYLDLADIYSKRGDSEFAIEQLKSAISVDPNCYDAKLKMADISLESGKYKQAISVYSELVGIDGYNDNALTGLANAYYGQAQISSNKALLGSNKDLYKALDYINTAIDANSKLENPNDDTNLELHLAKLRLSKITNQPKQAQMVLNKIVQSNPNDLTGMVVKGEAYLTMNDYKDAALAFDNAIKLSRTPDEDTYLSEIFMYHKQYQNAEKVLQKILNVDSQNQEALNDLDYIQKSKKHAEDCFKSAQFFVKSKNYITAIEYLNRSIAINPNNPQAHLLLAQLYEKQKNYSGALVSYKAYLSLMPNAADSAKIQKKIKIYNNRL